MADEHVPDPRSTTLLRRDLLPARRSAGTAAFRTVLDALTDVWDNRRGEVEEQADELSRAIGSRSEIHRPDRSRSLFASAGLGPADRARPARPPRWRSWPSRFDPQWGGFGGAPKFPQPALVDLALSPLAPRPKRIPTADHARQMAVTTLDAMAAGGIHDHLGGGFARYSTDAEWLVPHFEKMLYDQAGLLRAFLHGWQVTGRAELSRRRVDGIIGYVGRDLTAPEGGVYSAEDADSEGVEGRFYVWSPEQMAAAVAEGSTGADGGRRGDGRGAGRLVRRDRRGELRGQHHPAPTGRAPPCGAMPWSSRAGRSCWRARATRVRPGLDDKVLTEWNAMYGSALAEAAAATGRPGRGPTPRWPSASSSATTWSAADGRWLRSWQPDGGARHLAYAGDYAWLIDCFTRLGELTGQARWTERAGEHRRRPPRPVP